MEQKTTDQFLTDLEQMPIEDVRSQFADLFSEALAIEDAECQQTPSQDTSNDTTSTK